MRKLVPLLAAAYLALSVGLLVMLRSAAQILEGIPRIETSSVKDHEMQYMSRTGDDGVEVRVLRPASMEVQEFLRVFTEQAAVPPKKATWTSGGDVYMVVTPTQPGEPPQDWCDRHDDLVAAAKKLLPPDE